MNFYVVTLMPEQIQSALSFGVIGQALKDGRWTLQTVNPREFSGDVHQTVVDRVFGGGDGMLMMAEPLARAVEKIKTLAPDSKVIHLSPRGRKFTDELARNWAKSGRPIIFVASRYAGADERFIQEFCDDEISVGDFVVSGGDLPAALVIDAILRHRPGILGNQMSAANDSFASGMLESAQYSRPKQWRGYETPSPLSIGDPVLVDEWRFLESLMTTIERRADLIEALGFSKQRAVSAKLQLIESRISKELRTKHDEKPASVLRRQANEEILTRHRDVLRPWEKLISKLDAMPNGTKERS